MKKFAGTLLVVALFPSLGCDVDVNQPPTSPAVDPSGVNVDVGSTPADVRLERRDNLRDAVDSVDVEVGNGGGVKVDVDGQ